MVDCGISFADDTLPGVDIIMPIRPSSPSARRISTACCDSCPRRPYRAIQYLWPLQMPGLCHAFTASVLRAKLTEAGWSARCPSPKSRFAESFGRAVRDRAYHADPFDPEPNAVVIRTPLVRCCIPATGNSIPIR